MSMIFKQTIKNNAQGLFDFMINEMLNAGWVNISPSITTNGYIMNSNGESGDLNLTFQIFPYYSMPTYTIAKKYPAFIVNSAGAYDVNTNTFEKPTSTSTATSISTKFYGYLNNQNYNVTTSNASYVVYSLVDKNRAIFITRENSPGTTNKVITILGMPLDSHYSFPDSRGSMFYNSHFELTNLKLAFMPEPYDKVVALPTNAAGVNVIPYYTTTGVTNPNAITNEFFLYSSRVKMNTDNSWPTNILIGTIMDIYNLGQVVLGSLADLDRIVVGGDEYLVLYNSRWSESIFKSDYIAIRVDSQ